MKIPFRLSERLQREVKGKTREESYRITDLYAYLIWKAIDRHVLEIWE